MKKSHHKLLIILAGGIFFLCLLLFLTPFLWESPVFLLLKSDKLNGYRKAGLIALYKPAPKQTIREYVHLYNGGYEPRDFTPGPVYIPEKGYNYQDSLGLLLTGDFYQEALPFRNGLGKIRQNTFYGMLNHRGRMVISPLYDTLVPFSEVIVLVQGREYGVANRRGKIIIPLLPRRISNTYHGRPLPFLMAVESDGSYSVIDGKGIKKKTRPFDSLDIRNNTYYICRDDKWGGLDEEGNELIPTLYDHIDVCDGDSFIVSNGGFEGLHLKGKAFPLVPIVYDKVDACTPATFIIMRDGHYGLLDRKAKPLIEPVYDTIYNHHPQEWIVTGDHGRYTLRNTGKLEYPTEFYEWIGPCRDGMTVVRNENGYGVLSSEGKTVVPPQYDTIRNYSSGVAIVVHNKQYGVIDRNGLFTLPFSLRLVEIYDFQGDMALSAQFNMMDARIKKQVGFIDKKGNTLVPFIYQDGHRVFSNGLAGMKYNGLWGYINKQGETIIPFLYDSVSIFSHGMAQVDYRGQIITIDKDGRKIE